MPYLLVCAFIANAASFVLPIPNPANLVVYSRGMPPLGQWLLTVGLPSVASILVTFLVLRWLANKLLSGEVKTDVESKPLSATGKLTLYGIGFVALTLLTASAFNLDLGAPACVAGFLVAVGVSLRDHKTPKDITHEISWSVIPLVAGLIVIGEAINGAGALGIAVRVLQVKKGWQPIQSAFASGFGFAFISNCMSNLPSGLISGAAAKAAGATGPTKCCLDRS